MGSSEVRWLVVLPIWQQYTLSRCLSTTLIEMKAAHYLQSAVPLSVQHQSELKQQMGGQELALHL